MPDAKSQTEAAAAALVAAATPEIVPHVFTGIDTEDQLVPCVVCLADNGREYPLGTGNHWFDLDFLLKSPADPAEGQTADQALAAHNARALALQNLLFAADLAARLSAAAVDFTCQGILQIQRLAETDGRLLVEHFKFRAYTCPLDISDS